MIYQTNVPLDLALCICTWIYTAHLLKVYEGRRNNGRQ